MVPGWFNITPHLGDGLFLACFKDLIAELINSDWIGDFENSVAALKMRRIANNINTHIYICDLI